MNDRQRTIDTYNKSAEELAAYFQGIGARKQDINKAFELMGSKENPLVIEIGCGDGRDAAEITKRTNNYVGFDISEGMIKVAKRNLPKAQFEVSDAMDFIFPHDTDLVFAFASILHLDKEELSILFQRIEKVLKPGGIIYISTKYMPEYTSSIKKDTHGERLFYFYNSDLIKEIAGKNFSSAAEDRQLIGSTNWLTIALRKNN